ncbi:AhpC/TSA family protein [Paraphaeosphaeria sporulosa]
MGPLGSTGVGQRAPDFHCRAVVQALIEDVTLSSYINEKNQWLILMFFPTAFSSIYQTEVLDFQSHLDEFQDRNCNVVFCSVNQEYSLWHWQNLPQEYGGLGRTEIALLSDATHNMSRDYGVLVEEEGVCLRSMFIVDQSGTIQEATLNELRGPSAREALRRLDASLATAK